MDGWMDEGWLDGWMDGWMKGGMGGGMDDLVSGKPSSVSVPGLVN